MSLARRGAAQVRLPPDPMRPRTPAASESQMQTALASLTALRTRGEFQDGFDRGWLDSVFLHRADVNTAPSEPSSLALLVTGTLGVGASPGGA